MRVATWLASRPTQLVTMSVPEHTRFSDDSEYCAASTATGTTATTPSIATTRAPVASERADDTERDEQQQVELPFGRCHRERDVVAPQRATAFSLAEAEIPVAG